MTYQNHVPHFWAKQMSSSKRTDHSLASQPVVFFDGDFRTWSQVEQRVQLNRAIVAHLAKHTAHW